VRLALTVTIAALTASCARPAPARLVVATVRQPATALIFVARARGCLAAEGVELEEHPFELGRDALALLRRGGADVAIAYQTPVVRAAFSDRRLRILTALHTSTRNTRIVARRDRGVASFAELAGKRVGVAPGTNTVTFLDLALRLAGVPEERVEVVPAAPDAAVAALAAGTLDAAVLFDPMAALAERRLGEGAATLRSELYADASLLVTRDDVLAARADGLRRLLRALACAERAALADPDAARAAIRGTFPELDEADLRAELDRVTWRLGLDHVLLEILRRERDGAAASGDVPGTAPDVTALLAPRLLDEVSPDAVMLLLAPDGTPW
jgi:ABC-type nitrate/sulfonate/bicarbonate transport system substrate-binding protein